MRHSAMSCRRTFLTRSRDAILAAAADTSLNLDDTDSADHFLRALENRPVTAAIAIARGRDALAHSNYQTAFHSFDAALAMDPKSTLAAWGIAEADRRFGNNEKARQEFARVLERDPNNLRAIESLRLLDTDFSRWPEAESLARREIAADPHARAAAYAHLGEIYFRAGDLEHAYDAMQAALSRDPYNFQAHLYLGQLFVRRQRWAEARQNLEFIMRFYPDEDPGVYSMLFHVDSILHDPRAAAEAVRFGLRVFPGDPDLLRLKLPS